MKALKQAVHTALRDDSTATIGLRALLMPTAAATPYGVYYGHFPEVPSFKSQSYLTWLYITTVSPGIQHSDERFREQVFSLTAWSMNPDTVEDVLRRARRVLENLKGVTRPSTDVELHQILFEHGGPDLFDQKYQVYYRAEQYRAWFREDITT